MKARLQQSEKGDTVTLAPGDLESAIALLADHVHEVPLYRWLLGDHISDLDLRKWLAEILVRPLLNAGCVFGSRRGDRLVGLLLFQPHDADLSPDGAPPLSPADVTRVASIPGLRERFVELLTSSQLAPPVDDAVSLRLALVSPAERGGPALIGMMREIERFCTEASRPYYAWTGSESLRRYYAEVWGASEFGVEDWNGITMYGLVSDRPPRPRPDAEPAGRASLAAQRRSSSPIV
ncbi:hypothetical protein RVF83_18975 [Gordonia rubripertincta]|uniref:GNAT family N-acetyltransferase n=2 Tax=Gordonia rubripertincta TaxID=36822 RepID=A0AAW6RAN7_GORRU|nr:hypothetical protein [Gordonia rubripertincta]MDG6781450.1 hypothetical protein [Gordonia rubripertincta]NKY61323.1 hypothetical protein [Gordonia rubripertincta]NKY61776.1 hypothetical protein [Gordonia rubripertincta]TSD99004.1 hypothetical protein FOV72_04415 [Gordonia rubripertincta]GAB83940.1 hypothetical protein GORBP_023_00540 [Gordonia rubripertincta NBRC 101908]